MTAICRTLLTHGAVSSKVIEIATKETSHSVWFYAWSPIFGHSLRTTKTGPQFFVFSWVCDQHPRLSTWPAGLEATLFKLLYFVKTRLQIWDREAGWFPWVPIQSQRAYT